jgi:hypothetical protein
LTFKELSPIIVLSNEREVVLMKKFVFWECFTVRNGFLVEAETKEEAIKKFNSKRREYSHYKTEDWVYDHEEMEEIK